MSCQVTTAFSLVRKGDFPVERVADRLGLSPSRTWRRTRDGAVFWAGWGVQLERLPLDSTDVAVRKVLEVLLGYENAIRECAAEHGLTAQVSCTVTILEDRPLYSLTPEVMGRLSALEAEFLFEVFDYSEEEE